MKKHKLSLIVVTILGSLMALSPLARAEDAAAGAATQPAAATQAVKRPDALQRLDKELTLTDEQKTKIKPMLADQAKQMKALRGEAGGDRTEAIAKIRQLNDDTNAKIKAVLTPEQQTKFAAMLEKMKQRAPNRPATKE
jgi:periplasmic protein CpxP/Spy